jgi:hypothetical protein
MGELLVDDDSPFAEVWDAARRIRQQHRWTAAR